MAIVKFASRGDEQFVIVGTVKDLILNPRSCSGGYLHVYQLANSGRSNKTHSVFWCTLSANNQVYALCS